MFFKGLKKAHSSTIFLIPGILQKLRWKEKPYPVVKMYPVMGESKFRFDWVQDNVTDLDVNLVTIGLPGGSGTSVRSKKRKHVWQAWQETSKYQLSAHLLQEPDAKATL